MTITGSGASWLTDLNVGDNIGFYNTDFGGDKVMCEDVIISQINSDNEIVVDGICDDVYDEYEWCNMVICMHSDGDDENDGLSENTSLSTLSKAASMIPDIVLGNVYIRIYKTDIGGSYELKGKCGNGDIRISMDYEYKDTFIDMGLVCTNIQPNLYIKRLYISSIVAYSCDRLNLENVNLQRIISINECNYVYIRNCEVLKFESGFAKPYALEVEESILVRTYNLTNVLIPDYGIKAYSASTVVVTGSYPEGSVSDTYTTGGAIIR